MLSKYKNLFTFNKLLKNVTRFCCNSAIFLITAQSQAQESAAVLPKGIFRTRAVTVTSFDVASSFDDSGARVGLLNKMNATIPASAQAAANPDLNTLYEKLNQVESGLGDRLFQTDLYAVGSLSFQRYVAALEYGIRSDITIGILVPIVRLAISPTTSIGVTTQSAAIISKLQAEGADIYAPLIEGVQQFEANKPTAATYQQSLFLDRGYDLPSDVSVTGLSDIEVGGKWQLLKTDRYAAAVQAGVRLPTASHIADPSNILDRSTGDKQWDLGTYAMGTYEPIANTVLGSALKYTLQLPDTRRLPVPSYGQVGLTDLNSEGNWDNVKRNLGDIWEAELSSTQYFMDRALYTYATYNYSYKGQDSMKGSKALDYAALEAETLQISHRYELGVGYSTIPAFRAKRFPVPMDLKVAFNGALAGSRNVPDAAYSRFDVYLYF